MPNVWDDNPYPYMTGNFVKFETDRFLEANLGTYHPCPDNQKAMVDFMVTRGMNPTRDQFQIAFEFLWKKGELNPSTATAAAAMQTMMNPPPPKPKQQLIPGADNRARSIMQAYGHNHSVVDLMVAFAESEVEAVTHDLVKEKRTLQTLMEDMMRTQLPKPITMPLEVDGRKFRWDDLGL